MEPSAEDHAVPSSAAQNLLKHIRDHRRVNSPEPLHPEFDRAAPIDSPQAQSDDRPQVELTDRQRHCTHPATMIKRFDDGLTYCRLCYACLTP